MKYLEYKYIVLYNKNETMEKYVLLSEDYLNLREEEIEEAKMLAEGWNPLKIFGRKTGALTSQMLGGTKRMGTETFNNINENVRIIEELIDKWNKEHEDSKQYSGPLTLKIDKAKLDLTHLISLTYVSTATFMADIFIGNLLNYRMLIRPIRNAKIITLGYKYYLAIIRSALQQALITLEFSSDMFFSQLSMCITSSRKKMRELHGRIFDEAYRSMMNLIQGSRYQDEDNKFKNLTKKEIEEIGKLYRSLLQNDKQYFTQMYGSNSGMNQNIFIESGRNVEALIRANQDKEIQSLAEQFNTMANTAKQEAKEMATNYVNLVKSSAEARAQRVAAQINMNMIDVLKMFSLRNLENYSSIFENMDDVVENNSKLQAELDDSKKAYQDLLNKKAKDESEGIKFTEEEQAEIRGKWDRKGIDELFGDPKEYDNLINGKLDIREYMQKKLFTETQVSNIVDGDDKVDDYAHITMSELKEYNRNHEDEPLNLVGAKNVKDYKIEDGDSDKYVGWLKKSSKAYKNMTSNK